MLLQTLQVWEGLVCDDILKLHRSGELKEDWWNCPILLSEEHKDAMYVSSSPPFLRSLNLLFVSYLFSSNGLERKSDYYNQGPTNDDPENEIRAIEAGYQGPGSSSVVYYPRSSLLSLELPEWSDSESENQGEDNDQNGDQGQDSDEGLAFSEAETVHREWNLGS